MRFNKAIFFDRDGVLVRETGDYTYTPEKFDILPGVADFMAEMKNRGYLLFVITNQGGIGRGLYTKQHVHALHAILEDHLRTAGIELTQVMVCPHHPVSSKCICRKPGSLLLERALSRYHLNPAACYLIGDQDRDMEAATAAGINPVHLTSNSPLFSIIGQIN